MVLDSPSTNTYFKFLVSSNFANFGAEWGNGLGGLTFAIAWYLLQIGRFDGVADLIHSLNTV